MKSIFFNSSPLFYTELGIICNNLKVEVEKLYKMLDEHADWSKIFIAYYRTLFMNRLRNESLICKVFDLILVCKITILIRWRVYSAHDFVEYFVPKIIIAYRQTTRFGGAYEVARN